MYFKVKKTDKRFRGYPQFGICIDIVELAMDFSVREMNLINQFERHLNKLFGRTTEISIIVKKYSFAPVDPSWAYVYGTSDRLNRRYLLVSEQELFMFQLAHPEYDIRYS